MVHRRDNRNHQTPKGDQPDRHRQSAKQHQPARQPQAARNQQPVRQQAISPRSAYTTLLADLVSAKQVLDQRLQRLAKGHESTRLMHDDLERTLGNHNKWYKGRKFREGHATMVKLDERLKSWYKRHSQ